MIMDIHKQQMDLITNSILKEVEDPKDLIVENQIEEELEARQEKLENKAWEDTMTEEETQELELKQEQEQRYGELDRAKI